MELCYLVKGRTYKKATGYTLGFQRPLAADRAILLQRWLGTIESAPGKKMTPLKALFREKVKIIVEPFFIFQPLILSELLRLLSFAVRKMSKKRCWNVFQKSFEEKKMTDSTSTDLSVLRCACFEFEERQTTEDVYRVRHQRLASSWFHEF